jgi:hypothetical protein
VITPPETSIWPRLLPLLAVRACAAALLVLELAPVSVDDYFRVFHAEWWWNHISFASSYEWTPGYAYVYGPIAGLTHDMLIAPRVLTAALQIAAAIILALSSRGKRSARLLAAGILLFSPLSLVLGTVPLSESLFVCLLLGGAVLLTRFLEHGDVRVALFAAVLYLAATTVRYEGFAFSALFSALVAAKRPVNASRRVGVAVAAVPWIFPVAWTALLWASTGVPLSFLGIVHEDHFGAGDLAGALASAEGAVTALIGAAAIAVCAARIAVAARRGELKGCALEIHAAVAAVVAAVAIAVGDVPSQYPLRLFFPAIAFGALPLAQAIVPALAGRPRTTALVLVGAALAFAGAGAAVVDRAPGVPQEDLAAAAAIREGYASGELRRDDHVVVEHDLPSAAGVFVFANLADRVHIDALSEKCAPKLLTPHTSICPDPEWAGRSRMAVVRAGGDEERYVVGLGWALSASSGSWRVYVRSADGLALTRRRLP